ncbi:MAG: hypothetical protein IPP73_15555 [Chitinophagaceae bacterium]|nr:hypothetical protein [Chitinophagaceae bacterium]
METPKISPRPLPVLTQTENNTTLWVGHFQNDPDDHFAGQTFNCPSEGQLDNIQVYSASVHHEGELQMTLHEFNTELKSWGDPIANSTFEIEKNDNARWIRFSLPPVDLRKGTTYGFRINSAGEAMVGLGEAATNTRKPFTFGHEWNADSRNLIGHFFSYFSLAFKVELSA